MGILNICNLWILLRKIVIYILSDENVISMDFFVRQDILQFFPGESKDYNYI